MTSSGIEAQGENQESGPSIELACELGHYTIGLAWDGVEIDGMPIEEPLTDLEQSALRFFIEHPNIPRTRMEIGHVLRKETGERISQNVVREAIGHLANPDIVPLLHQNLVTFGKSSQTVVMLARDVTESGKPEISQALREMAEASGLPSHQEMADQFDRTGELRPMPMEKRPRISEDNDLTIPAAITKLTSPAETVPTASQKKLSLDEVAEQRLEQQHRIISQLEDVIRSAKSGAVFDSQELTEGSDLTEGQKVINFRVLQTMLKAGILKSGRDARNRVIYIRTGDED